MAANRQGRGRKPLVILRTFGYPGSGKTYFSQRLAKKFGYFHLSAERLRREFFDKPNYTKEESRALFRVADFLAEELLARNMSVVFDANAVQREFRIKFMKIAKRYGARYNLLWFQTPIPVALKRLAYRRTLRSPNVKKYYRPAEDRALFYIKDQSEDPRREPFLVIDGTKPFRQQVAVYQKWLKKPPPG